MRHNGGLNQATNQPANRPTNQQPTPFPPSQPPRPSVSAACVRRGRLSLPERSAAQRSAALFPELCSLFPEGGLLVSCNVEVGARVLGSLGSMASFTGFVSGPWALYRSDDLRHPILRI